MHLPLSALSECGVDEGAADAEAKLTNDDYSDTSSIR
jgi:hypothetical protein